ncbi:RelA/SpoT family protein [Porphyromonadaceae bacterium OttesenSCG-928-L07]|nr:RelA/SpoT family protein [Porphyromonadaceae bacterium OttesenSCG-928-L07]MDL2251888.1 RelA/SpoT family protein [Odoribacter sp. OttesenSCG-928-J03]MDL2283383.1 RelA/SpoT family protein [Odoribacter sp. OttesenSCG-928-G04]
MTDQELINNAFEDLLASLPKNTSEENKEKVKVAFEFANEAHKGVRRRSGEPYILHPISVAKIVTHEIGLGTTSVISSLLHDVVEDTDYTVEDIATLFNPKVASIVDGLTKISEVMGAESSMQAESFRKVILTLADDVRVILIKIADRLHNMRTLSSMPVHKQMKIAGETLYIYAPLAHRMGLHAIKTELEDLSLKYEHPEEYEVIANKIEAYSKAYSSVYEKFITPIRQSLDKNEYVHNYTITARTKSVYSVWHKMHKRSLSFDEIYDLLAVRIVFDGLPDLPEKWQCWNIYSLITDLFSPKPERIRDWVSVPKANGYEALHLTVMGPTGQWIEVQIRSKRMDEIDEKGLAAHWKYKNDKDEKNSELDKWLAGIKEMLEQRDANALDFLDDFKLNLYEKEIRVFTPKGYMKTLPKGATALDFAYDIHTEIGNKCIGAKVNHKLVPMSHKLKSGDQVEILTSEKQIPQKEWLDFIVTAKARTHIVASFKKDRKELLKYGIALFESLTKQLDLPPTSEPLKKMLEYFKLKSKDDFYLKIAEQKITAEEILRELKKRADNKFMKYWKLQFFKSDRNSNKTGKKTKKEEVEEQDVVISSCCSPIPGDDVVGLNIGGKITVHKRRCPEAIRLMASYGDKIVPVEWVTQKLMSFPAIIKILGIDRVGLVSDVTTTISKESEVNMRIVHFETIDGVFEGMVHVYVHNTEDLSRLITRISNVKGVKQVVRVEN